jgi:copper homeostasis protein
LKRVGYETDEKAFLEMIYSIEKLKVLPLDGFVLGVLDKNKIDREKMKILLKAADPLHITFHKAIDCVEDVEAEIKWLNTFPQVDTILSSGKAVHASDGTEELIRMKKMFKKQIMAGGKVTPEILPSLHEKLDLQWYHGRSFVYATQPL